MSSAWFVPLPEVAKVGDLDRIGEKETVRAIDLPSEFGVPGKLYGEGIRPGDVIVLFNGTAVAALARIVELSASDLLWRRLPLASPAVLAVEPSLRQLKDHERSLFSVNVDGLLWDVSVAANASPPTKTHKPTGPASNIILYGPPGTGKTHSVRQRALELIGVERLNGKPLAEASGEEVYAEWERLRSAEQVVFCTFHQAFAYEEFVEGLRADTDEAGNVRYSVKPGIFKRLALRAAAQGLEGPALANGADFQSRWARLLTGLPGTIPATRGPSYNLEKDPGGANIFTTRGKTKVLLSREWMESLWAKGLGAEAATELEARPISWSHKALAAAVYRELYRAAEADVDAPSVEDAFDGGLPFDFSRHAKHYVLVIDEINRANIARVFGELITLLEPDKRLGNPNELRVQLPASKEWFGVPPNLHVLATMNTADRSIALMDVALRRRFTFEEMMPDAKPLGEHLEKYVTDVRLRKLIIDVFTKLNERLRYLYDREHQIGHAYFFSVKSHDDLRDVFATKIIPLLQEYFFGHWEKVALALGHPHDKGMPKERGEHTRTVLTAVKALEKAVLGFDHDDYEDQLSWEVHPAFRPRGSFDGWSTEDIEKVFREVAGDKVT